MFQGGTWIFAAPNPAVTPEMLRSVRQDIDYKSDVCRITNGSHIEPWPSEVILGVLCYFMTFQNTVHVL
jgi:hypothetical protein